MIHSTIIEGELPKKMERSDWAVDDEEMDMLEKEVKRERGSGVERKS